MFSDAEYYSMRAKKARLMAQDATRHEMADFYHSAAEEFEHRAVALRHFVNAKELSEAASLGLDHGESQLAPMQSPPVFTSEAQQCDGTADVSVDMVASNPLPLPPPSIRTSPWDREVVMFWAPAGLPGVWRERMSLRAALEAFNALPVAVQESAVIGMKDVILMDNNARPALAGLHGSDTCRALAAMMPAA